MPIRCHSEPYGFAQDELREESPPAERQQRADAILPVAATFRSPRAWLLGRRGELKLASTVRPIGGPNGRDRRRPRERLPDRPGPAPLRRRPPPPRPPPHRGPPPPH